MFKRSLLIILFGLVTVPPLVHADDDQALVRRLHQQGEIVSLETILEAAGKEHSGRLLEAELERRRGTYVYEVEILDNQGRVWELYYDAQTGELIKQKEEH